MRIQRSVGLLSALRFFCSESSVLRTDSPIIVSGTSSPWHGSIGVGKCDYFFSTVRTNSWQSMLKILLFGSTAISFGLNGHAVLAKDDSASESDQGDDYVVGLHRIEDSSVISNSHTIKWRIFTNNGRDLFQKGKLDEAEKFFLSALQEAKEGFGPRDAHVGSSCSNLAAIYTSRKAFDKAEPLYLEAISILEDSFGIHDIRVGATLHNLGHFYLLQRKVEQAQKYYERALKIKGRVLGYGHPDYSSTMHHLSLVLYLQGKEKDSEELLRESIRILEENGLGETITCMKRTRSLVQGWSLLETIIAAEDLAKTLHFLERLEESQELLERCLNARKKILPCDDVQVAANMLHLGRITLLKSNQLRQMQPCDARSELEKAKFLADNSIRIAGVKMSTAVESQEDLQRNRLPKKTVMDRKFALIILLQSLDFLGLLKAAKNEMPETETSEMCVLQFDIQSALHECISIFREPATRSLLLSFEDVKEEYISCLNHLMNILLEDAKNSSLKSSKALEELIDHAQQIKGELSSGL
ncbi:uncharacterized protein LOC110039005 isoform X2 [Phalaenopsis equestris]|uniref:uncharacterized protein LOC110039005 isoform X2 n=1 Tax=Phalaenopsis equestris TaxID=78828 RepID=UPI0009E3FC28|nr:uncharacterized protein LOC110039005 isoform X2 [Phalaenopsis equestris]